ncbi:uric acid degradation bifunctional protein TTL isoform X1 [Senna tora]|uniref:Uric acid degradation bifunctional protein TTL isoform X1 n=1 Tax=Senna tora TaxID=362788 RepID=A0A834TMY4_9FABA|nr:uric acid degradation bifunctional protein TTL isoform X1 [Senna tora]
MDLVFDENDFFGCCGSARFAKEMALASPFVSLEDAISAARDIWFNKVDVNGWLEAFSAHPQIGGTHSSAPASGISAEWSKREQSTALATATNSSLQELSEWNARYRQKFGFVFLICASGRSTEEILAELKRRYPNRPLLEFENASQEQMKITELRLAKLFTTRATDSSPAVKFPSIASKKAEEGRLSVIGGHVNAAASEGSSGKSIQSHSRTRPPITTHVLDVSRGSPASGVEVLLETWKSSQTRPTFGGTDNGGGWVLLGSSTTDSDGRSGQLLSIVDDVNPGIYRISFNTGKYNPNGFFPYVSVVFEINETQKRQHFHVPLLLSPFSFSTYRGS